MNPIPDRILVALLVAAAALAQSRPEPSGPGSRAPAVPTGPPVRSRVAAPAVAAPSLPLVFGWREGGQALLLEIEGDRAAATLAGQVLPAERIRRAGSRVQVLDADGLVAGQVSLIGNGGTLQTFPERNRVVLGLRLLSPDAAVAQSLGFKVGEIRRVGSVTPGLGAARAGLQPGDLVVELAGERPVSELRLRQLLATRRPGDRLPLRVRRGDQELAVEVPLERAAAAAPMAFSGQPFVEFDGSRMVVVPPAPPPAAPGEVVPPAVEPGVDPLQELRSVQDRLDKMERLLQRMIELREKRESGGADREPAPGAPGVKGGKVDGPGKDLEGGTPSGSGKRG